MLKTGIPVHAQRHLAGACTIAIVVGIRTGIGPVVCCVLARDAATAEDRCFTSSKGTC